MMSLRVPIFREPGLTEFLTRMIQEREIVDDERLSKITANHSLLLQSPNGSVYEVKVSDAGALTFTLLAS